MCVRVCEGGGRGKGDYSSTSFFIFFSFCRNLALNHVNFHFPAMFFSPSLLNFEQGFL